MKVCDKCKEDFEDTFIDCPNCGWDLRIKEKLISTEGLPKHKKHLSRNYVLFVLLVVFLMFISVFIGNFYFGIEGKELKLLMIPFILIGIVLERILFKNGPFEKKQLTK